MNKEEMFIRFNDVTVSLLELRVRLGKREIHCTLTDLRLLLKLLEEPYKVVPFDELVRHADLTNRRALWVSVCRLRKLLEGRYVVSHIGIGYAFARIPWELWQSMRKQHATGDVS